MPDFTNLFSGLDFSNMFDFSNSLPELAAVNNMTPSVSTGVFQDLGNKITQNPSIFNQVSDATLQNAGITNLANFMPQPQQSQGMFTNLTNLLGSDAFKNVSSLGLAGLNYKTQKDALKEQQSIQRENQQMYKEDRAENKAKLNRISSLRF